MLEIKNPITGDLITEIRRKSTDELRKIAEVSSRAQVTWENTPMHVRTALMRKWADVIGSHESEIISLMGQDMGKPFVQAKTEVADAASLLRASAERAMHLYGEVLGENTPGMEGDIVFTKREPLGVIACIIPFNFPVELMFQKVAPALAMGNTVIVKAPSSNPLAILKMEEYAKEAGIPEGVVQCVVCYPKDSTEGLIKNPAVAAVALTGSTEAGIRIAEDAAGTLKHCFLELGGNDAFIIFDDVDIQRAVGEMIAGRLENNGQVCCASKRFIVHEKIYDRLADALVEALKKEKRGLPCDPEARLTTLISEKAAAEVERQIRLTVEEGAELVYGGEKDGAFITPAVLKGVTGDMEIAADMEVFGPVFPLIRFSDEQEAVDIANISSYGLSSGVLSGDMERAIRVAGKMKAGGAVINGSGLYRHYDQAFGGFKMSGIGREGTSASLEEFSHLKTYIIKNVFA